MADQKITALTDLGASVATTDTIAVVDATDTTTKRITVGDILALFNQTWLTLLPVGATWYGGTNSANPSTYLPGHSGSTWVANAAGEVIAGKAASGTFGTIASVGAETVAGAAHTHALSSNGWAYIAPISGTGTVARRKSVSSFDYTHINSGTVNSTAGSTTVATELGGATDSTTPSATSVVQPTKVEYIWKRTA